MSDNPFATSTSSKPAGLSVFDAHAGERAASSTFLLGQVMFLVAVALAFFAGGTYIGRDLSYGTGLIFELGALGMLIVQMFVPKLREGPTGMTWMFALALLLGLGLGPVINEYATVDQSAIYQAAGGTALTVGVMGSYGFATSRDLIRWMRPLFFALLGVFGLAIVLILIGSGRKLPAESRDLRDRERIPGDLLPDHPPRRDRARRRVDRHGRVHQRHQHLPHPAAHLRRPLSPRPGVGDVAHKGLVAARLAVPAHRGAAR